MHNNAIIKALSFGSMDKVFLKIAFLCVNIKHKCVFMHDIFDTTNILPISFPIDLQKSLV
ncbi:hypothetical protein D3C80_694280 [compost metagenome]